MDTVQHERESAQASVTATEEIARLAEAMMNGRLDERGDPARFTAEDAKLIGLVNGMLDSLVSPLRLAAGAIEQISHGTIPAFVVDDYRGEYNDLKRNLNVLLATLYGMHNETQNLITSITEGKLRTRGNDWDFDGIWRDLIGGVNGTLDAVIDPVTEASTVLSRLASYDLQARMRGKYRGEHAVIKRAMNGTAESLHAAIAQVAESVGSVTEVGNRIARSSRAVEQGATEQDRQISEASSNLSIITESSARMAENTADAQRSAQSSVESITTGKETMERMLAAMLEIRSAADNTVTIVQEIDAIAKETELLSSSAGDKAVKIRSSAGGFAVVAGEIRKLSARSREAAKRLDDFGGRFHTGSQESGLEALEAMKKEFAAIIGDLSNVALVSHYLGLNAATEAAHVEVAGDSFEGLTEQIRQLALRATTAAKRTGELIRCSVENARKGESLSQEIDGQLAVAVQGGQSISRLTEEITLGSREQASRLDEISGAVAQINEVTRQNAESARESAAAAKTLEQETLKLSRMVDKFQLGGAR